MRLMRIRLAKKIIHNSRRYSKQQLDAAIARLDRRVTRAIQLVKHMKRGGTAVWINGFGDVGHWYEQYYIERCS